MSPDLAFAGILSPAAKYIEVSRGKPLSDNPVQNHVAARNPRIDSHDGHLL
jgi:hypothetical protein